MVTFRPYRDGDAAGVVTDPHLHPVTRTFPPGLHTDPLHVARLTWLHPADRL